MTVDDWLKDAQKKLKRAGVDSPRLDALLFLEQATQKERSWLQAHHDYKLSASKLKQLNSWLERRLNREPLAYILNTKEFMGLQFFVNNAVLIPRPETEVMVEEAVKLAPNGAKVLEIGTGSGCISLSLAHRRSDLKITAGDISLEALKVAEKNAKTHKTKVNFLFSDLFSAVRYKYGVILANLPYVPDNARRQPELDFEPSIALFGGSDGLELYRKFFEGLSSHTTADSLILIEAGPTQRLELANLASANGYTLTPISEYIFKLSDG